MKNEANVKVPQTSILCYIDATFLLAQANNNNSNMLTVMVTRR